jgi:hypothetical protein
MFWDRAVSPRCQGLQERALELRMGKVRGIIISGRCSEQSRVGSWNCAVGGERRLKSRHNLRLVSAHISLELVVSSASEFIAFARAPEIRKYKLSIICFNAFQWQCSEHDILLWKFSI